MNKWTKISLFCITALCLIGCDRVTKDLAKQHLVDRPTISYFHDTLRFLYVENTGAAMGLGDNLPKAASFWLLSILPLAFLLLMAAYAIRKTQQMHFTKLVALSMIIAGGLGNVIDRLLFDRHVTDFINIGIGNIRTGIFNLADFYVSMGAILLIISFRKSPKDPVPIQ